MTQQELYNANRHQTSHTGNVGAGSSAPAATPPPPTPITKSEEGKVGAGNTEEGHGSHSSQKVGAGNTEEGHGSHSSQEIK